MHYLFLGMTLDRLPLIPQIEKDGQPYWDKPIYLQVKPKELTASVAAAFGRRISIIEVLQRYEHTKLRWMKPDGKGGLVQR